MKRLKVKSIVKDKMVRGVPSCYGIWAQSGHGRYTWLEGCGTGRLLSLSDWPPPPGAVVISLMYV